LEKNFFPSSKEEKISISKLEKVPRDSYTWTVQVWIKRMPHKCKVATSEWIKRHRCWVGWCIVYEERITCVHHNEYVRGHLLIKTDILTIDNRN